MAFLSQNKQQEINTQPVAINPQPQIFLDLRSSDADTGGTPVDFTLSKNGHGIRMRDITRFGFVYVNYYFAFPNVNDYNNGITIEWTDNDGHHIRTDFMTNGFYDADTFTQEFTVVLNRFAAGSTQPHLADADKLSLETAVPAMGGWNSWDQPVTQKRFYLKTSAGTCGPFKFIPTPGQPYRDASALAGLIPYNQGPYTIGTTLGTWQVSGLNDIMYSRSFYITCSDLYEYNIGIKDETSAERNITDIVFQLFSPTDNDSIVDNTLSYTKPHYQVFGPSVVRWISFEPNKSVSSLRFKVLDQWGQPAAYDPLNPPSFEMVFLCQNIRPAI